MSLNQDQYKLPILNCEVLVASVYPPSHSGETIAGFGRITTLVTVGHEIQWLLFIHIFLRLGLVQNFFMNLKEKHRLKAHHLLKSVHL